MTKMAVIESMNGSRYDNIKRYEYDAYVKLYELAYAAASVIISAVYIVAAIYIILLLNPSGVSVAIWIVFAVVSVMGVVWHIYFAIRHGRRIASDRYEEAAAKSAYMDDQYKILDKMYEHRS